MAENILEYIDALIEQGYRVEDAEKMANVMFSDDFSEDDGGNEHDE